MQVEAKKENFSKIISGMVGSKPQKKDKMDRSRYNAKFTLHLFNEGNIYAAKFALLCYCKKFQFDCIV